MAEFTSQFAAYIGAHPDLAMFVIAVVAFGESFAFVGFLFPGSALLMAAGTMVQAGVLNPAAAAVAAGGGAMLGDIVSYAIGHQFGAALPQRWPYRHHPAALERCVHFFRRYGWPSVFIGRFFGPLRAFITLIAGMFRMNALPFLAASLLSAALWAPGMLFSGYLVRLVYVSNLPPELKLALLAAAAAAVLVFFYVLRRAFHARSAGGEPRTSETDRL